MLASGCDDGEEVTVINSTTHEITVLEDGAVVGVVPPDGEDEFGILRFTGSIEYTFIATDGEVIASRSFTWDEIDDSNGITIVVD
jgi:hypothetical protein